MFNLTELNESLTRLADEMKATREMQNSGRVVFNFVFDQTPVAKKAKSARATVRAVCAYGVVEIKHVVLSTHEKELRPIRTVLTPGQNVVVWQGEVKDGEMIDAYLTYEDGNGDKDLHVSVRARLRPALNQFHFTTED